MYVQNIFVFFTEDKYLLYLLIFSTAAATTLI